MNGDSRQGQGTRGFTLVEMFIATMMATLLAMLLAAAKIGLPTKFITRTGVE